MSLLAAFSVFVQAAMPALTILPQLSPAYAEDVVEEQQTTPTPEPTSETTIAPTPTEESTPTPTAEVTPTIEATPTVTATPTETVTATPTQGSQQPQGSDNQPPQNNGPPAEQGQILDGVSTTATETPTPTVAPAEPETGELQAVVLQNVEAESLDLDNVDPGNSASLSTDKADYAPTDTAVITGKDFTPGEVYTLTITSENSPPTSLTVEITADENGEFVYAYQLDGNYRPFYRAEAKNSQGEVVSVVTFTDSETVAATIPFSDSFGPVNSDQNDVANWYDSDGSGSNIRVNNGNGRPSSPTDDYARIEGAGRICRTINATGYQSLILKYYWLGDDDAENNEFGRIQYKTTGSCSDINGWADQASHELENQTSWSSEQTTNLPASLNGTTFYLRFVSEANQTEETFRIDDVSITGTVIGPQADLTATKTNNVSNNATVNQPFTWTIRVQNSGAASATFASGNTILTDNLPDSGVTYGSPSVTKSNGTVTGTINCSINSSNLSCTASGGSVVIPVGQYIDVSFSATFSSTGSKVNPRSGGSNVCKADPSSTNGVIPESNEGNNTCSNTVNVATVQPVANPSFPNSCGLDVALVIDSSLSIDSTELGQMKTAFQNFVNAFLPATPTQFSVTEFDTTATVTQAFTSNTTLINNAINNAASSGYTNWEDGLLKAQSTLPNRSNFNLVLFASDGNPNTIGNGPGDNASPDGSTTAMNPAITAANAIKTAGSRIIALGIGNELSTANLQAISGPNVNTGVTSDVITSNFSTLATDLATLANQLCGGTITARKMIGQNPASNWTFTINGQNYVTDANGYTQAVSVSPGTYSVTETQKNGYAMTSASCTGATNNGSQGVNSVTGVQVAANNIVSCVFNNSLSAFCGDGVKNGAEQCDGSDLGGLSSSVFSCSNQCTLNLIDPKVTICHATDSHSNPYITNQPNKSADVSGHDGHTGPIWFPGITQTWGDIIPPFDYVGGSYPGKNWTTEGQAIYNSQCTMAPGTLIVQKTTLPAADQTSFAITATGSGTITGGGAGTITDANDKSYTVTPGIYSVTEDVPTGWTQTSNTCSNVSVASGQTKTCVITNGKLPTITVNKVVVNDDGGQKEIEDFALFINAVQTNSGDVKIVPPGAYTISETADNGYVGTISGDCTTNGNVTVAYGDTKVCTITNDDIPGSLTVHKLVDRDGNGTFEEADPSDFTWTIDGSGSYVMGATNTDVAIGMRAIGENSPAGYHFVSWYPTGATDDNQRAYSCDNPQSTSLPINVNVGPGGTSDYTLCNARDMGTVTFEKLVVGGNASPSAWTFTVASVSGAFHSGDSATLPTGTYSVTESGGDANYSATSATGICSALQNQTASLTVTTEGGTCTFTNTHDTGSVKVNKRTDKNGDGDYTDSGEGVNGSASNAFTWSLDGSGTNVMGATVADILTGNHDVNENTVANYHFVGWFTNGGQYSCTNPEGTTLPVTVGVTKGNTAEITLCNARDAGTVTIIKNAINNSENNFSFDTNLPGGDFELEDDGNDNNGGTEESKTVIAATGAYTIKENNESGWKLTGLTCDDNNGQVNLETRTATVNVSAGEQITCTFTNTELAKVWGFKFYDKNGNAAWNLLQGELGLGNWRIFIDENENQAYDVGESNKLTSNFFLTRGYYEFTNLLPGTYTICEELQTGWKNTLPLCQTVELSPGEVDHFVDFGNIDVGDLTVTKYNDENGNGVRDEGEEVLSGWEINLTGEDSQTTGENGTVLFANLPKGTYGLSETMQPQWRQTNISCSNDPEVTPTPSPTPGDEEETGGTCHYDEGENEYSAINVPITNPGHSNHEFDFEYEGEYSITGQEGQLADEWCNENIPEQEVEVRKETFLGISKVHAQRVSEEDESTHPVTVEPGEHVTCEIGNQVVNPELTITKSNNTGGADKGPGDSVMFTIEVTASDSAVLGVTVTDLPSLGFTYEPGSWTANSNVRGDLKTALVTTEPTYASPGDWILGDMVAGETVTLTYLAKIGGDIQSGLYRDLAWSEGTDLLSAEVVANDDTGVFVGTEVNVVKGDVQGVSTNVVKEEGSVLGASTELPATGASIFWLAMAGILGLTGVTSMTLGLALARRNKKSKRRLHA